MKGRGDVQLNLFNVLVTFADGSEGTARAEGNNASWHCKCEDDLPLIGRCYFASGHNCYTVCPTCKRTYRVRQGPGKRTRPSRRSQGRLSGRPYARVLFS
jgi:hypothetical protein